MNILKILIPDFLTLYFGGGGGGDQAVNTVEKNVDPWAGVQPYMQDVFSQAQDIYRNDQPQFYPNETYIDYSPQTMAGLSNKLGYSGTMGNTLANNAAMDSAFTLGGGYINSNPYMDDAVGAVTGDVMNAVNSTFAKGGRFGGAAHADTLASSVGDVAAKMRYQDYANERENMARYQALAPQSYQMGMSPANTMIDVGTALESKEYEKLNSDINRWNYNENLRGNELAKYNQMIQGGMNFGQTSGSSTSPVYGQSPIQGAIGGGLAGYGLASTLGAANPLMWGLGAGVLGGLFS